MPVEPGFIDANVLVYAMDADAPQHDASRALLEAAQNGATTLFVTPRVLCEFYSLPTHAACPSRAQPVTLSRPYLSCSVFFACFPFPLIP